MLSLRLTTCCDVLVVRGAKTDLGEVASQTVQRGKISNHDEILLDKNTETSLTENMVKQQAK